MSKSGPRQWITEAEQQLKIIGACHADKLGGHFGRDKTREKIASRLVTACYLIYSLPCTLQSSFVSQKASSNLFFSLPPQPNGPCRYYWSNMTGGINSYVKTCEKCQRVNKKLEKPAAKLHPITVDSPWYRIGIDLVGPLPRTASGNAYIITCTDFFTKWPEASAIPDKSALSVASFLFQLITRHGSPVIIQSDQGREFVNQVNKHLFERSGVEHRISAAYHPQTNGLDERFNQTLVNALTKVTGEKPDEWDEYIDPILFAYRCVYIIVCMYAYRHNA